MVRILLVECLLGALAGAIAFRLTHLSQKSGKKPDFQTSVYVKSMMNHESNYSGGR
jgi:hypothetical protein